MLKATAQFLPSTSRLVAASTAQLQVARGFLGGAGPDKTEPTNSPWVKILERPGDEHGNRSEEVHIENPYKPTFSEDVSADVPEKNPDTQPQAPIDPEVVAAAEANKHSDSVRMMADKLNQAVGGDADFPETGGASIREMASEIGHNIGEKLGVHQDSKSAINSKADEAMSSAADKVADSASSVVEKAREAVTGSKDRAT